MLSRLISRITETEYLIEKEIREATISHLREIHFQFRGDEQIDEDLRAKIDRVFERQIAYEEQQLNELEREYDQ